jgi:chaperonin GroES
MAKRQTVVPLYDRLLVRKIESADVTEGGIIIPESAKEPLNRGIIVAAGSGKMLEDGREIPLKVKVGDEIIFGRFAGTEVQIDGQKLVTMREDEVYGIVTITEIDPRSFDASFEAVEAAEPKPAWLEPVGGDDVGAPTTPYPEPIPGVVKTYEVIQGGEMPNPRATDGPQNIGPPDIYSVSALAEPIPPGPFAQGE